MSKAGASTARDVDPGFRREGVFTATIAHPPADYTTAESAWRLEQRVLAELRATPGIASAGAATTLPLVRGMNMPITIDGVDPTSEAATEGAAEWRSMTPGYLKTLGVPVDIGRDITDADDAHAPLVVIVSQSLATHYWPGESPLGKRVYIGRFKGKAFAPEADEPARVVIGVVPDLKDMTLEAKRPRHTLWVPQAQLRPSFVSIPSFAVRANDPRVAAQALRRTIQPRSARSRSCSSSSRSRQVISPRAARRGSIR